MFSNGTEYYIFMEQYCFNCTKLKADAEGIPYRNSCRIEKKIAEAMFDPEAFPKKQVYIKDGQGHICTEFKDECEYKRIRKSYVRKPIDGQVRIGD